MGNLIAMVVTIAVTVISGNPMLGNLVGQFTANLTGNQDGINGRAWPPRPLPDRSAMAGVCRGDGHGNATAADAVLTQMAANAR